MLNVIDVYYFSPTGGTKKVAECFGNAIAKVVNENDLGLKNEKVSSAEGELAVFAAPVFAGRIAANMAEKLRTLKGNGKKAVTLVVYGNRAYDDALLELNDIVKESGFEVVGSGAFIAQHSIVTEVAAGRPDEKDISEIQKFAQNVLAKLQANNENAVKVPGNTPYRDGMQVVATPICLDSCSQCGKCEAVCPTGAIVMEGDTVHTSLDNCLLCMACVANCPKQARVLPAPMQEGMNQKLGALKDIRRENECFI